MGGEKRKKRRDKRKYRRKREGEEREVPCHGFGYRSGGRTEIRGRERKRKKKVHRKESEKNEEGSGREQVLGTLVEVNT